MFYITQTTSAMDTSCQQKGFFTFLPQNITKAPHYCCPVIDNLRSEAKHMGNILNEGEHEHPLIKSKLPPQPHGSNNHSLFQRSCSESKKRYHLKKHLKQPSFMNGTYTIRFSIETSYQYRHDHKQRKIHQSHPNMLQ